MQFFAVFGQGQRLMEIFFIECLFFEVKEGKNLRICVLDLTLALGHISCVHNTVGQVDIL